MTAVASHRSRGRITALIGLIALLATFLVQPATAAVDSSAESQFVSLINAERKNAGLAPLSVASDLVSVARKHSARMASENELYHNPNLGSEVTGWKRVGENVGRGPSVSSIHTAFMNSAGHRKNILDPGWTQVGVGVEVVDGRVWVTEVFRTPSGATAPAPEATEEEPETQEPAQAEEESKPAPKPSPTASAPAPKQTTASTTTPAPAPEPTEEPEPVPISIDRFTVTMAQVESAEQSVPVASLLDD